MIASARAPATVQAVVAGTIAVHTGALPPRVVERLRRDLSLPNPAFVTRKRLGRYVGTTPEWLDCLVEDEGGWLHLPRGAVRLLRDRVDAEGLELVFDDRRTIGEALPPVPPIELRPYQREAVTAIRRGVQGTVVMPCGGGKTVVGAAAIGALGRSALVLVHSHDLLEQWRAVLAGRLGIEAGIIAEGKVEPDLVTVATVQTLVRLGTAEFDALVRRFGVVLVDEAHHAPAATFQMVLGRLSARWRIGLTATPEREDGLGALLDFTLGPRLFEIGYAELVAGGYLQAPEVEPVFTSFTFDYRGPDDLAACLGALVEDEARNHQIVELVAREAAAGHQVLVLSGRVEHCRRLATLLGERGVVAEVLIGATPKAKRRERLEGFRDGRIGVLVASTVADEGLDVPRLDRIVLAYPGRTRGRTTQRLGRLMRRHPDKGRAVLFDIVDGGVPVLRRQYLERRRLYRDLLR